jgi:hypothetical protein
LAVLVIVLPVCTQDFDSDPSEVVVFINR